MLFKYHFSHSMLALLSATLAGNGWQLGEGTALEN